MESPTVIKSPDQFQPGLFFGVAKNAGANSGCELKEKSHLLFKYLAIYVYV